MYTPDDYDEMDSYYQQRFDDWMTEAKMLADSNPQTKVSLSALAWYNRQPKPEVKCPRCRLSNKDFHFDSVNQICPIEERFLSEAAYA